VCAVLVNNKLSSNNMINNVKQQIKSLFAMIESEVVYLILMYLLHFLFAMVQVLLYGSLVGVDGLFYLLVLWNSYWFTAVFIVLLHHHKTGKGCASLYLNIMQHWWFISSIKLFYTFVLKDVYPLIEELLFGELK
jgi:hypothetical protein